MEALTVAALGSAGTTAGVAGATATTAATAGLLGTGGAFSLGNALTSAFALASAGLSVGGAMGQSRALQAQAEWGEFNASAETVRGQQEANRIRQALLQTLASNNAGRAAAGVELSGSAIDVDAEAAEEAERELSIVGSNARVRSAGRLASAQSLRVTANATRLGGFGTAATGLFGYVQRNRLIG